MQKKYFPIFVDISQKKIVVIGGGVIATRRVHTLLQFAGQIVVISPEITSDLQKLHDSGQITWLNGTYCSEQMQNADIVIAATNKPELNHQVRNDCIQTEQQTGRRILVSVIDDKEQCDFYFPSIVQSEDIVIGINSGGKSPSMTKKIRKKIEEALDASSVYEKW